jgi:uncharacterized protein YaaN involved in tellurite resistance
MFDTEYQKVLEKDSDFEQGIDDILIEMKRADERIEKHQTEIDALGVETRSILDSLEVSLGSCHSYKDYSNWPKAS